MASCKTFSAAITEPERSPAEVTRASVIALAKLFRLIIARPHIEVFID
jgi:hypothetical protein